MKNIDSYFLYIFVFLISLMAVYVYDHFNTKNRISKLLLFLFISFPIILLQGFRYDVGTDYLTYSDLIQGFYNNNQLYYNWYSNEPIFLYFSKFCYSVFENPTLFFVLDSIIMNYVFFKFVDYHKTRANNSALYLYLVFYFISLPYFFNAERQGLSVVIVWYSTKYVKEKNFKKFILCIIIATLIHNTAIVGLSFYLFNFIEGKEKKPLRIISILLAISAPLIFEVLSNFLFRYKILGKYAKFLLNEIDTGSNVNFFYWGLIVLIVLLIIKKDTKSLDFSLLVFMMFMQLSTFLLNRYISYGFRLSYYYQVGVMLSFSEIKNKRFPKLIQFNYLMLFLALFLFYFSYKFYIQGNSEIFPYHSIITMWIDGKVW